MTVPEGGRRFPPGPTWRRCSGHVSRGGAARPIPSCPVPSRREGAVPPLHNGEPGPGPPRAQRARREAPLQGWDLPRAQKARQRWCARRPRAQLCSALPALGAPGPYQLPLLTLGKVVTELLFTRAVKYSCIPVAGSSDVELARKPEGVPSWSRIRRFVSSESSGQGAVLSHVAQLTKWLGLGFQGALTPRLERFTCKELVGDLLEHKAVWVFFPHYMGYVFWLGSVLSDEIELTIKLLHDKELINCCYF